MNKIKTNQSSENEVDKFIDEQMIIITELLEAIFSETINPYEYEVIKGIFLKYFLGNDEIYSEVSLIHLLSFSHFLQEIISEI